MYKILSIKPNKLKGWRINSFSPILDLKIIGNGVWVAGGALRLLLDKGKNEKLNDIDLFFDDLKKVPETREKLEKAGARLVFECPEGKLFTYQLKNKGKSMKERFLNLFRKDKKGLKVQLICEQAYSNPISLILSFDFGACCAAFDGSSFYIHSQFVKDVKTKKLSIINLSYPVATMKRIVKYSNKGYNISGASTRFVEEILKMTREGVVFDEDKMRHYID